MANGMNNAPKISRTLVDNWLLELVDLILRFGLDYRPAPIVKDVLSYAYQPSVNNHKYFRRWMEVEMADRKTALLHFLDLIVVNDELIYDIKWSTSWPSLRELGSMLSEVRLSDETRVAIRSSVQTLNSHSQNDTIDVDKELSNKEPAMVQNGAFYYMGLARFLGIYYWPSPRRAEFIARWQFSSPGSAFAFDVQDFINNSLGALVSEMASPLQSLQPKLIFPGFGSSILANCRSAEDVIPMALEFRNTKEAIAFRRWLVDMEQSLVAGNVKTISKGMRDLRDVIDFARKGLGLSDNHSDSVELQIGLSPGIAVNTKVLQNVWDKTVRKSYHVVFLRRHLERVLDSSNVQIHIKRLFA